MRKIDLIEEDTTASSARMLGTIRSINAYLNFKSIEYEHKLYNFRKDIPSVEECIESLSALENDVR